MNWLMTAIGLPLGWIMWLMYKIVPNYAVALILFTISTRLLMLPLTIKQQKSTVKMQIIAPRLREIQDKYRNNSQKMNEELQRLYEKEDYSPYAGCLPMLIQLPILFGLIDVIYKPLTHIMHISQEVLSAITSICTQNNIALGGYAPEIGMLNAVKANSDLFQELGMDVVNYITSLNLTCCGLDLSVTPDLMGAVFSIPQNGLSLLTGFGALLLIPVFSGVTSLLLSLITIRNTPAAEGSAGNSMKTTMFLMPLMSLYFTSKVPAGVGLYWIVSNLVAAIQSIILNRFWNPKEMAEKIKAESEARRERERLEKIEAKKRAKEEGREIDEMAFSQKERNRQRLAEARRRNAEKYGDYGNIEVSDDDLK